MNPQDEALDLIKNPLPSLFSAEDMLLPTLVWNYDDQIARLELQLKDLRSEREEALARALKNGCLKNKQFVIEKVEKEGDRKADPALLKSRFPAEYKAYVTLRSEEIKANSAMKMAKEIGDVEKTIHLGTADKVFGKKNVNLCSTKMVSTIYVVKKVG